MAFADSPEAMRDAALRFKRDDAARKRIAEAGWRKAHAAYNERLVARLHRGHAVSPAAFARLRLADDAVVSAGRIGVVLPSREAFTLRKSGAVALCARDFARFSRFADRIDILGAGVCDYPDVAYRRLEGWRRWWRRERAAYADAVAAVAPDYALLEVQNRPYLMARLRRRAPRSEARAASAQRSAEHGRIALVARSARGCSSHLRRGLLRQRFHPRPLSCRYRRTATARSARSSTARRSPKACLAKEPIVAFTGRVAAIKGVAELVAGVRAGAAGGLAAGDRRRRSRRLAGGGTPRRASERLGQVSHAEAMALLARAEIACVPSLWDEPCARAAVEALAQGCALVTSRRGGLPEIAGDAALFVDPADIGGFRGGADASGLGRSAAARPAGAGARAGAGKARDTRRDGAARRGAGAAARLNPCSPVSRHVTRSMAGSRRGIAQPGSAEVLGTSGRRFESCCPDHANRSVSAGRIFQEVRIVTRGRSRLRGAIAPRVGLAYRRYSEKQKIILDAYAVSEDIGYSRRIGPVPGA